MTARLTMAAIKRAVAAECGLRFIDLEAGRRDRATARPRQVAMYLGRRLTRLSTVQIGRELGDRDHTTVLWGVRQIELLRHADPDLDARVRRLEGALNPPAPTRAGAELQPSFLHGPLFDRAAA